MYFGNYTSYLIFFNFGTEDRRSKRQNIVQITGGMIPIVFSFSRLGDILADWDTNHFSVSYSTTNSSMKAVSSALPVEVSALVTK